MKLHFKSTTLIVALALAAWAPLSHATVIIGNYSGANDAIGTQFSSGGPGGKAAGFTMNAGTDFQLDSVKLRLNIASGGDPLVSIYSNSSSNNIGSLLAVLTDPTLSFGVNADFVFTPASPLALLAGSSYWLTVQNSGTASLIWRASSPAIIPSGSEASSLGYLIGSNLFSTASSTTRNTFEITGSADVPSAVPEPTTSVLIVSGLLAGGLSRRRNKLVA